MSIQMCEKHWNKCVRTMKKRGFSHLISEDREQAVKRLQADINGGTMTRNYDPALHLMWNICHNLLDKTKEGVEIKQSDKPKCPLCLMESMTDEVITHYYMNNIADDISKQVIKHNLQG